MRKLKILKDYDNYILTTYTRTPGIFVKGKGMTLVDITGKKYLDFFPGWGVSNVGHCHPKVVSAVRDQIGKLIHIPNNFSNLLYLDLFLYDNKNLVYQFRCYQKYH